MALFDFFKTSLTDRARESSQKEVRNFVEGLRGMSDVDMGTIIAVSTVIRVNMEKEGYLQKGLYGDNPLPDTNTLGRYQMDLNKLTRDFNKKRQPTDAIGVMVISYSLRCLNIAEMRDLGCDMWVQLKRGFPHVKQALVDGEKTKGAKFLKTVWSEWQRIPVGLEAAPETPETRENPWKKT